MAGVIKQAGSLKVERPVIWLKTKHTLETLETRTDNKAQYSLKTLKALWEEKETMVYR